MDNRYVIPASVDLANIRRLDDTPIPVLDSGHVRLVDVMGNDAAVVQAARVSYGDGTTTARADAELINYLLRHWHTTPFEMCEIKLHVKLPIFVARQWIRHRTASVNEYSGRYSEMKDEFYLPDIDRLQAQSSTNKQGSEGLLPLNTRQEIWQSMAVEQRDAREHYIGYNAADLARELSRINLPVSNYTEWYWKIDLKNLLHFLNLRQDSHAQYEIRVYAGVIAGIVKEWLPVTYAAYENYIRDAINLSAKEQAHLATAMQERDSYGDKPYWVNKPESFSKGEWAEFKAKVTKLKGDL